MEKSSEILDKIGRKSGMTVPEGYFADFASRMTESLSERQFNEAAHKRTFWQKIRPYTYMAAMFAGIWCMMKMFSLIVQGGNVDLSIDNYPVLQTALADDSFVDEFIYSEINRYDIIEDIYEADINPEELFTLVDE